MKKLIRKFLFISTLIVINTFNCFSQSTQDLDKRNGFKNFKFGDLQSKYQKDLIVLNKNVQDIYEYKGKMDNILFGWRWGQIWLMFSNGKLSEIVVYWRNNEMIYNDLLNNLSKLYGMPIEYNNQNAYSVDGLERLRYNEWAGKNINMTLQWYKAIPNNSLACDNCTIMLRIENEKLTKQALKSDF